MPGQFWRGPWPQDSGPAVDGTALANSTTLTDINAGTTDYCVLPSGLLVKGRRFRLKAKGELSTTSAPTLILGFYYGGVAGAALAASTAVAQGSTVTAVPWDMEWEGEVRSAVGGTATIYGVGQYDMPSSLTARSPRWIPETAAARVVTVATNAAKALTVGAQWGTASASNTITCRYFACEFLN